MTDGQQIVPDLGSHLEQAVDDRHRQIMSGKPLLKRGSKKRVSKALAMKRAQKALAKKRAQMALVMKRARMAPALMRVSKTLALKRAATPLLLTRMLNKAVTDLTWQEHPSMLADLRPWSMPAQKSAKTVFFEENAKGSTQKWGDGDDEDMNDSPQKNDEGCSDSKDGDEGNKGHNAITEESASSSSVVTENSKNSSLSGKDEQDPTSAQQCRKGSPQWVRGKLQERQHPLSHSPPNSPGRVNPLGSPREDPEDEVMQVDAQGNNLTMPLHLAEQIDAIQEEEVDPESLLLQEMHSRRLRGELNSTDDVLTTFENLLGEDGTVWVDFMYDISLRGPATDEQVTATNNDVDDNEKRLRAP
jgi:hypothetical protein